MEKIMEILNYRIEILDEIIVESKSDCTKETMELRKKEVMAIMKMVKEEYENGNL